MCRIMYVAIDTDLLTESKLNKLSDIAIAYIKLLTSVELTYKLQVNSRHSHTASIDNKHSQTVSDMQ